MATWLDTYSELFTEADVAKNAAKTAFLASLTPPNPPALPLNKVIPLADAITTAQWQALLYHIGPVSSDGSVTIGLKYTADTVPVPQLDLTGAKDSRWIVIDVDPTVAPGVPIPPGATLPNAPLCAWQVDPVSKVPVAIWVRSGLGATDWSIVWPASNHRGIGTATISGAGIVTLANSYHSSEITIAGGTVNGILNSGWQRGDDHRLIIHGATHTTPVDLVSGVAVGAGKLPLYLPYSAATDANTRENIRLKASPAILDFYVDPLVGVYLEGKPTP